MMLLASVASAAFATPAPAAKRASSSRPTSAAVRRGAPLRKMLQDAAGGVGSIGPTVVASGPPSPLTGLAPYVPVAYGESMG